MYKKKFLLYIIVILLYFFSFPPFLTGFLSYFVLIPFFFILELDSFKGGFRNGYLLGLFSIGILTYWLNWNSGATQIQATAMYLGTIMYLAVMWGIFGFLQNFACKRYGAKGFLFAPFFWTTLEYVQSMGEMGFTWHFLPTTQTYYLPLIQFIEFTGISGLTFWITLINVLFYFIIKKIWLQDTAIPLDVRRLSISLILIFFVPLTYGFIVLNSQRYSPEKKNHRSHRSTQYRTEPQMAGKRFRLF